MRMISILLIVFVLAVVGCADSEKKSEETFRQGMLLMQEKSFDKAEKVFEQIKATYPDTVAAEKSGGQIRIIFANRQLKIDSMVMDVVGRVGQVIEGYRSVFGKYPASRDDLLSDKLFFDAPYIEEMIPVGVRVVLMFKPSGVTYSIGAYHETSKKGFIVEAGSSGIREVSREAVSEGLGGDTMAKEGRATYFRG